MPARDTYDEAVIHTLVNVGWKITHDSYVLSVNDDHLCGDAGAERIVAAEGGTEKIAVEIKSLPGPSELHDLSLAVGQFVICRLALEERESCRRLVLAVPDDVYRDLLQHWIASPIIAGLAIGVLAFRADSEEIGQ